MKKGLVIGNSHVAMIAKSWRDGSGHFTDIDLDFFAQPGDGPKGIEFDGTVMQVTDPALWKFLQTTGMISGVDLADYDFLVVVACGLSIYPVAGLLRKVHVWGWPSCDQIMKKGFGISDAHLISTECLNTTLHDILANTLGAKLVTELRRRTTTPIFIVAQPLPSERLSSSKDKGQNLRKIEQNRNNAQAYKAFESALNSVFSPIKNTTVIFQPKETIIRDLYTGSDFTTGAVRLHDLNKTQAPKDTLHANHHYGALILDKLCVYITKY